MNQPECRDCGEAMERGFVLDRGHYNVASVTRWYSGVVERSWWGGIKPAHPPTGTGSRRGLEVVVYRCPACGVLESYAPMTAEG